MQHKVLPPCSPHRVGTRIREGCLFFEKRHPSLTPSQRKFFIASEQLEELQCLPIAPLACGKAAFTPAIRLGVLLSSAAALPVLWQCAVIPVYQGTPQCGERSNAAFRKQSAAQLPSLAPHDSKARLRLVSIRRRFMAKPCTPHLHCAARAALQASDRQCRGSRGPPLAFSWGFKGAILSRERMAPFAASPHGVGINPKKYHFLNFLIVSAMIFCFKIMLTST